MSIKKIIPLIIVLVLLGIVILVWPGREKVKNQDTYRYEYRLDYEDERYTDQVSVIIYKKNITTGLGEPYSAITDTSLYRYISQHYGLTEEQTDFIQFSMTQEYIEGLSADNKFISGKLMDPKTKQQIGHWVYDLDKDDFKKVVLYGLTPSYSPSPLMIINFSEWLSYYQYA